MLEARSTETELMDAPGLDEATYRRCLRDLAAVNRVTRTHVATLRWLADACRALPRETPVAVLDVACGEGDLLRAIAAWGRLTTRRLSLSGLDINPRGARAAAAATPAALGIMYHTGDAFTYAPATPVDFIVTSQFTHHLDDASITQLLRRFEALARRGWLIIDLHRHWLPYFGFRLLCRAMRWHRIVRHDGTVSIARSFTRADWTRLLATAGVTAEISWQWLFRWSVGRVKEGCLFEKKQCVPR